MVKEKVGKLKDSFKNIIGEVEKRGRYPIFYENFTLWLSSKFLEKRTTFDEGWVSPSQAQQSPG